MIETPDALVPDPVLPDPAMMARGVEIADAIQRAVAARPDLAVSLYGIGLDALSTRLRHEPAFMLELDPWLRLAVGVYDYVIAGIPSAPVDRLVAGDLSAG